MDNNLKNFGYGFQTKVISLLLSDRQFIMNMVDVLHPEYFDNKSLGWLSKSIMEYFKEYRLVPTLDVFKVQLSNVKVELERQEIVTALKDVLKNKDSNDLEFVKSEIITFCHRQELKAAIYKCVEHLDINDFDKVKSEIDSAYRKTVIKDDSLDYLNDIEYRYSEQSEPERVATGWDVINDIIGGGLPKGKMGVVMAPTGIGKTWILCHLGAAALKKGLNVLHYTLELDDIYTAQRYDTILTGIPMTELKFNVSEVKKKLSRLTTGKLIIEEHPPGTLSIHGLEASIDRHIMFGIKPDLIILDYGELMDVQYNTTMREDKVLGEFYKNLRGLAGRKEVAFWTADQTNRGGASKDVVEGDSISNAFAKLFVVDFLLTVSRRPKDKKNNTARFFVSKSRLGVDGVHFPAKFDTTHGVIELYVDNSDAGEELKEEMEDTKNMLNDIYDSFAKRKQQTNNLF